MKKYIQKDIEGYIIETDDNDLVLGLSYQDFLNGNYIQITEDQENYLNDNPEVSIEELINVKSYDGTNVQYYISISPMTLEIAKKVKINSINQYDNSDAVNEFTLNGTKLWLTDEERTKLSKRLDIDKKSGLTTTKLIHSSLGYAPVELPIEQTEQLLLSLEQYARDCFDKTNEHISEVLSLTSVEDVEAFDITEGYPSKLSFTI